MAPVCMYDGFAGYRVCRYCHTPDPTDTRSDEERIIPAGSDHTGTKQPLYQKEVTLPSGKKTITWTITKSESNGKRYNYKEGSCTEKGCEGDFLCSACQRVIPGKWDYKHPSMHLVTRNQSPFSCFKNGYSGDEYCELCGKLVNKGYVIEAPKKHETLFDVDGSAKAAACTVPGKEADQRCYVCDEIFSGKAISALGHNWVVDTAHCTETTTAYKCNRAGCTATKFADVVTDAHAVKVDGGTALVGGKAVKKAAEGETVTLKLGTVPEGKRFKEWEVVNGGVVLTNATDQSGASFIMGALDVEINAVLENVPTHGIVVVNGKATIGAGSEISSAYENTVVTIAADPAESGKQFDKWEVIYGDITIADVNSATTTFTMGSDDVKVKATYDTSTEPFIFSGNLGESILATFKTIGKRFTYGGGTGKDQRVYYFNTKELIDNKFGTPNPIPFRVVDSKIGLDVDVSVRCSGVYSYKIADPLLFYTNVCGNVEREYTRDELDSQLKTEFISALQPAFGKLSDLELRPNQIVSHNIELEDAMNAALSAKWGELRGLKVVSIALGSVMLPEEDAEMIKQAQRTAIMRDPTMAAATLVGAQADAMKAAAGNSAGAMTGFMGMGMAMNAGGGMNAQNLFAMGPAGAAQRSGGSSCGR